jgi:hypothetical protein
MTVVTSHISTTIQCPGCAGVLTFHYESTQIVICSACRSQVTRSGKPAGDSVEFPSEDLCRLKTGATGSYYGKSLVITGRLRFIFDDNGYVNLWHTEIGGVGRHWIAESYNTYALVKEDEPGYPLSHLLLLKPGQKFTAKSIHYYLNSSETKTGLEGEGELPEAAPHEKMMYVIGTSPDKKVVHFRILNKKEYHAYHGENINFSDLNFSNIRTPVR